MSLLIKGVTKHSELTDVSTPHALADLVAAVCSEAEADGKITTHKGDASAHHTKTSKASEITSERFPMVRMPDMALNRIMVGQGAGVSPVEEDKPAGGLTFTELAEGEEHDVAAEDTWEDWDLSAIIAAGSKAVLIDILYSHDVWGGARKNGSALDRQLLPDNNSATALTQESVKNLMLLTECDASRVIEVYCGHTIGRVKFSVLGYWS